MQLRHVLEVHAIDAGDGRGHGEDGGPGAQFLHHLVLAHRGQQQVGFQCRGQQFALGSDALADLEGMVVDVAEIEMGVAVDQRHVEADHPVADIDERQDHVAQRQQVAAQIIDMLDAALVEGVLENPAFDRVDLVLQAVDDGEIAVDDEIHQGIDDKILALLQHLGGLFAAPAHLGIADRGAVAHRDDIAAPGEDMGLAELDLALDHLGGAQDQEQAVAIDLQLRALMGDMGIFDGEFMQAEMALQLGQQRLVGLVQADPDDAAFLRPANRPACRC